MDKSVDQEVASLLLGGVAVMLLLALALVVFFLLYQKRLMRQQLELQAFQSAYQKELLGATIQAEERERERIGSDLHDEIGSSLSAAKMLMAQLAETVTTTEKEKTAVDLIERLLSNSLKDIRSISHNLHPAVLARFGLAEALRNLGELGASNLSEGLEVQVEMSVSLAQSQELAIYRIVQELVNNALKHAQASYLSILLTQEARCLALVISDNGRGFNYAHVQQTNKSGLGLKSLAARVNLLDATLQLSSTLGQGTSVRIEIPLPSAD